MIRNARKRTVNATAMVAEAQQLMKEMLDTTEERIARQKFRQIMKIIATPCRREFSRWEANKVKARARFKCENCGDVNNVQSHDPTRQHADWEDGVSLCGKCHSEEHPEMAAGIFLVNKQRYWKNVALSDVATKLNVPVALVARHARKLKLARGEDLSLDGFRQLVESLRAK